MATSKLLDMSQLPDILSVEQAAAELSLTGRAIRHRIKVGTLRARKIGDGRTSAYVIERAEIERAKAADAA